MRRLEARALAVHLAPRVRLVALDEAHRAARDRHDPALAALLDPPEHLLLDQDVVREVVLAGLQHRARRAHRVAAALDVEAVEERAIRDVVALVELRADQVAGPELGEPVGPGADRGDHADGLARAGALDRLEDVARQQPPAGERGGPVGLRLLEDHLDRVLVEPLDAGDVLVGGAGARRGGRIEGELPVEDDVVRGEGRAVVPHHVALEPPGHPLAVLGERVGLAARDVLGQHRHQGAVGRGGRERLVEDPLDREVAQAPAEVRVQQGGGVPHQHPESAAAASPGRRELGLARLGGRDPRRAQEGARHRRAEPDRGHRLHEAPPGEAAVLHTRDQLAQPMLVHVPPRGPRG